MEKTAKALVEHWSWAADKGVMNRNTAAGLRAACTRVLAVLGDDWENTEVTTFDVEDLLIRFQNLKKKDYRPQVLEIYKQRFRKAVASYLEYLQNPGGWRPNPQDKAAASTRNGHSPKRKPSTPRVDVGANQPAPGSADQVEYPFPLRPGVMARLILPSNLTQDDVNRLSAFMSMLVMGSSSQQPSTENLDEH